MAAAKITQIWTVFITALVKCLAVLGLKATPEAATTTVAPAPALAPVASAVGSAASVPPLTALVPRQRPGDRSVPPTMKQRIRAEAHGSSPASRSRILSGRDRDAAPADTIPADAAPAGPIPTGPIPAEAAPADLCLV